MTRTIIACACLVALAAGLIVAVYVLCAAFVLTVKLLGGLYG